VGISKYAGIDNATFLCNTSLTIFDYERPKITYNGEKTSIRDVLSTNQFGKIYLMFGINECGRTSAERFFEKYANTVNDIRLLQPGAIVFVEGNLLVTEKSSSESDNITNDNISLRNYYISLLENKQDIFYIDINESELCENGALIPDYTWDQVHIKAQYYPIWKEFLLEHGVVRS
jgi:lysophospholipase L1-like esterase